MNRLNAMSNNKNQEPHRMPTVGLDESPVSAYAKAVNAVKTNKKITPILMGYTPPLFRVLTDIGNLRIYTDPVVLRKDMLGQGRNPHFLPAAIMLKVPYYLNNPIGILKSSDNAPKQGFVFVTDLQFKGNPIIITTHIITLPNGNLGLKMPSTYDKNLLGFQDMLNYDILCWDYSKTERFEQIWGGVLKFPPHIYPTLDFGKQQRLVFSADTAPDSITPLQVVSLLSLDTSLLYVDYDKTERYLSQAFPDLSVNPNLYIDAETVQAAREWTHLHAPMTRTEAQNALLPIYSQFMPTDNTAQQAMQQQITTELQTIYDPRRFITGADLPLFQQKAQQFSEEYKEKSQQSLVITNQVKEENHSLTKEEAYQALMSIYAQRIEKNSPAYQEVEQDTKQQVDEQYQKGESLNRKQLQTFRESFLQNFKHARNNVRQAMAKEQAQTPKQARIQDKDDRER